MKVTFGPAQRQGLAARGANQVTGGLEAQSHPHPTPTLGLWVSESAKGQ